MRSSLVVIFFILGVHYANGQNHQTFLYKVSRTDKNITRIKDSLYASKFECTNVEYRIFINDLIRQNRKEESMKYEVDSVQWRDAFSYNEPYVKYYHRHPAYQDFPVVNINHEAATAYCKWLTEKYNQDIKRKFKKVVFKLPSESEWILAANAGTKSMGRRFPVGEGGRDLRGKNGIPLANYQWLDEGNLVKDSTGLYMACYSASLTGEGDLSNGQFYMTSVDNYPPNEAGLYNMAGNVAEMLEEPGRTKGGSWASLGGYLRINGPDDNKGFTHGNTRIGFRVFMYVIEK